VSWPYARFGQFAAESLGGRAGSRALDDGADLGGVAMRSARRTGNLSGCRIVLIFAARTPLKYRHSRSPIGVGNFPIALPLVGIGICTKAGSNEW
jgi:hypothetical protein